jgi:hypothetical protein
VKMAVLMPMTLPPMSSRGPPEFPGFTAQVYQQRRCLGRRCRPSAPPLNIIGHRQLCLPMPTQTLQHPPFAHPPGPHPPDSPN